MKHNKTMNVYTPEERPHVLETIAIIVVMTCVGVISGMIFLGII